jgi:hypothetical protein
MPTKGDEKITAEVKSEKVFKSPLKPSVENAVEHLNYEKSSK